MTPISDLEVERSAVARWGGRETLDAPLAALTPTPLPLDSRRRTRRRGRCGASHSSSRGFPPWRAFGPVGAPTANLALKANARSSVARRFQLPGRTMLHGIALPLRLPAGHAEVRLEIAADADGVPAEGKPLATVDLVLDAPDAAAWHGRARPDAFR